MSGRASSANVTTFFTGPPSAKRHVGKRLMPSDDFEVWQGDRVLHSVRGAELERPAGAWEWVRRLASRFGAPGCQIKVKDERGDITILVGARTARRLFATAAASSRREKAPAKESLARASRFTSERRRYAASRPA